MVAWGDPRHGRMDGLGHIHEALAPNVWNLTEGEFGWENKYGWVEMDDASRLQAEESQPNTFTFLKEYFSN